MERKYRISGFSRLSKGMKYPLTVDGLFADLESAMDVCKTMIKTTMSGNDAADVYSTSIEGRKASVDNAFDMIASYSVISQYDNNVLLTLHIFPVDVYSHTDCVNYWYRGYNIKFDTHGFDVLSSGFKFIRCDMLDSALMFVDHFNYECQLQQSDNKEDDE